MLSVVYDCVTDWDLEQIAQDHLDIMMADFESGILDSHISDIEDELAREESYNERQ